MSTFPEEHWDILKKMMEKEGPDSVIHWIQDFSEEERIKLYFFAREGFIFRDWEGKNLDVFLKVVQAGIQECLLQAQKVASDVEKKQLTDMANRLSYNLSADLAACWPGDELPRSSTHFLAGLKAAEDCIHWREELKKEAGPFAMAYWVKAVHLLYLKRFEEAVLSFEKSLSFEKQNAQAHDLSIELNENGSPSVLNTAAYLEIARKARGDQEASASFEGLCQTFRKQAEDPEKKEDAEFYLAQLQKVHQGIILKPV